MQPSFFGCIMIISLVEALILRERKGNLSMEGIIKIGDGTAGRGISIQAAGFLALLGTAVLLNQAYPGMEGKTADGQITKIESEGIAGTIVKVWNPDDRVHVLKDAEGSVLKKLLTQDGPAADLIHAADSGSDRALILPDQGSSDPAEGDGTVPDTGDGAVCGKAGRV